MKSTKFVHSTEINVPYIVDLQIFRAISVPIIKLEKYFWKIIKLVK